MWVNWDGGMKWWVGLADHLAFESQHSFYECNKLSLSDKTLLPVKNGSKKKPTTSTSNERHPSKWWFLIINESYI